MDVSKIISKSRIQTGTSVWQKSDLLCLDDLNIVYKEVFSRLSVKNKKYTRDTLKTTSVKDQSEYTIPKPTVSETGIKRVLNVSIKYSSQWEYIPCKMYDTSVQIDSNYTDENIPYCIQRDGSIFIFPAPTEVIADSIVIEWQYIPLDLELTTLSSSIKLASEYHDVLISGLNMRNFWDKQLFDKKAIAKQEFDDWVLRIILEWWNDIESSYEQNNNEVIEESDKFLP